MKNKYYSLDRYLHDEIKSYNTKIDNIKIEKTIINKNTDLKEYQIKSLLRVEDEIIVHYKNRIESRKTTLKDKDFIYNSDLLTTEKILNPIHIPLLLNAYWKRKEFEKIKKDTKSYPAAKRKDPNLPDSIAEIRKELTESLYFANYKPKAVSRIMKAVIGNASKSARKQDEKTNNGLTIHIFQDIRNIE